MMDYFRFFFLPCFLFSLIMPFPFSRVASGKCVHLLLPAWIYTQSRVGVCCVRRVEIRAREKTDFFGVEKEKFREKQERRRENFLCSSFLSFSLFRESWSGGRKFNLESQFFSLFSHFHVSVYLRYGCDWVCVRVYICLFHTKIAHIFTSFFFGEKFTTFLYNIAVCL